MSVSRDVIADALNIPEQDVMCENCAHADRWINDAFMCKFWSEFRGFLPKDAFCSFFQRGEKHEHTN